MKKFMSSCPFCGLPLVKEKESDVMRVYGCGTKINKEKGMYIKSNDCGIKKGK